MSVLGLGATGLLGGGGGSGNGVGGTLAQLRQRMLAQQSGQPMMNGDMGLAPQTGGIMQGQGATPRGGFLDQAKDFFAQSPEEQARRQAESANWRDPGIAPDQSWRTGGDSTPNSPYGNESRFGLQPGTGFGSLNPATQPMTQPQQQPGGPLDGYTGSPLNVSPATVGTTPQNIIDSPAYQFRMNQGNQAVQQGAAAKGSLLTGGTLKDMQDYSQGLASTEFGNQWDRDYRLSALNSGISEGNAGRTLTGLSSLMGQGFDAARGMGGYDNQAGNYQAGGTVDSTSALNQGLGTASTTIADYLARRRKQGNGGWNEVPNPMGNEGTGVTDVTGMYR